LKESEIYGLLILDVMDDNEKSNGMIPTISYGMLIAIKTEAL